MKYLLVLPVVWALARATNDTDEVDIFCFACGIPDIDPELDVPGSFGDARRPWTPVGKKMYNYTCDIAAQMGLDDKWIRKCPHGVKSCFWSKSSFEGTVGIFRGCAPTFFPFDEGCRVELESVLLGTGSQRGAPRVELCFCNNDECNKLNSIQEFTSIASHSAPISVSLLVASTMICMN